MTEELKTWFNSKVEEIIAKVKDGKGVETAESVNVEVTLADNEEIINKFSDLDGKVSSLNNSIAELEGEKETLVTEVARMNALLSKADAKGTDTIGEGDPSVVEKVVVKDANSNFFDNLVSKLN